MPIMKAPELANTAFYVSDGDVLFASGRDSETGLCDTFLIKESVPGAIGPTGTTGRQEDAKAAGMESGKQQTQPADVALRFGSLESLESFVLEACTLLGRWQSDHDETETAK